MRAPDSFPLEQKIKDIFARGMVTDKWQPTGYTKELYVELSEPIVSQAVSWQDKDGRIIDQLLDFYVVPE